MKWGRKNSPSSTSSSKATGGNGGMSSWISKIKQISGNSKSPPPTKTKQKIKVNSSPLYAADKEEEEEAAYWRLSFGKENLEGKKSTTTKTVLGSVWFDSDGGESEGDDDQLRIRVSNHRRSNTTSTQSFTNMVSNVRKTKELLSEKDRGEEETPRRKIQKGRKVIIRKSRRTDRRNFEEDVVYSDSGRDDSIEVNLEPIKTMKNQNCSNLTYSNSRKSHYISSSNLNRIDDLDRIKTEKSSKKSIDQRRTSKVRSYSPRTPSKVEIIKIRAIEEIKKSKLKKKKEEMKMEMEGRRRRGLESCAMVKCSYDPQNDFRESMVEMILEKKIRRSEELEELLACYLTLNSDEHHDLIIKVFKQVWFDLNRFSFNPELENQVHSYSDYY